jgi:methionine-gamma-lyase
MSTHKFDPATQLMNTAHQDNYFGVNQSVNDSATFTFEDGKQMTDTFNGEHQAFLYSRHWNPTNMELSKALAAMEGSEMAWVTSSGMGAITCAILQLCKQGDHIVSSMTTYGGTFAFFKNWLPQIGVTVTFVDMTNLEEVENAIQDNTKLLYTETMTNPLLQISDVPALSKITKKHDIKLVIDNTFTPMIFSPIQLGADVVVYSMTKFINGKNDTTAGAICGTEEFINSLIDLNDGTAMLLGPVLDSFRASNIHKNLFTLHIRMKQHSHNAMYLAEKFKEVGLKVNYAGCEDHPQHDVMTRTMNKEYGYGGMISIDLGTQENASKFMGLMQKKGVGYLAVSLGYFKTLFSNSGSSTSSEVPLDLQKKMGLSEGLVRYSVGLDNHIEETFEVIKTCLVELKLI